MGFFQTGKAKRSGRLLILAGLLGIIFAMGCSGESKGKDDPGFYGASYNAQNGIFGAELENISLNESDEEIVLSFTREDENYSMTFDKSKGATGEKDTIQYGEVFEEDDGARWTAALIQSSDKNAYVGIIRWLKTGPNTDPPFGFLITKDKAELEKYITSIEEQLESILAEESDKQY